MRYDDVRFMSYCILPVVKLPHSFLFGKSVKIQQLFKFCLQEDKTAIQSLTMDSKIEIQRDLDALLINFANRHGFHGPGTFLLENDLFDNIAMNFITSKDEPIKDMVSCFTNSSSGLLSRMSFLEQVNVVISKAFESECVARRTGHSTRYFDSAAKLTEAIIQVLLFDFMECDIFLL